MWVYFWIFHFVPMIYISIFMPISRCLDLCSFIARFEVKSPPTFFFFQNCFGYILSPLVSFGFRLSPFIKGPDEILIRISLNLQFSLDRIGNLKILSFIIHEHDRPFHLSRSLISLSNVLVF